MENMNMQERIVDLAWHDKISLPQAKALEQLNKEGYNVEPALKGRIVGFSNTMLMIKMVKENDEEGIAKLIAETEEAEKYLKEAFPDLY